MTGVKKARRFNRLVSLWTIGLLSDRLEFKASARGSRRKQVNPCYTSQICPNCGFIHRKNRNGDKFHCLFCGQDGHSDEFAALNLLERANDSEIALWMPKGQVKPLLMSSFSRRLESWDFNFSPADANFARAGVQRPATVPGKTQESTAKMIGGCH